jgi:glycosyltransferase involved in cell wall biosynthesis
MVDASSAAAPRVSVICIFYNAERFFAAAVDSVLAQDCQDFELLLVDDGSSDGSTALAHDYVRCFPDRVRYLEHADHSNQGMSATRNLGLSQARGEMIAFIDSDDIWRPAKLREQLELLDAHPEAMMVCGAVNYWASWDGGDDAIVETGPVQNGLSCPPDTSLQIYPLGWAGAPCPSDFMIRLTSVEAVEGFEAHFTGARQLYEDQGFLAKVYLNAPVYFSTQVWLDYRQHADSCVAVVMRDNGYVEVRRYFLEWFHDYLQGEDCAGKARLLRRVRVSILKLDHPELSRAVSRVLTLARRMRAYLFR